MADDRFGETIIMLNKEKVRPSANAKSDEFLRETVALNVMSLWKCKEVMARVTATSHGNHHSLVSTFPDISLLVKHLVEDAVFEQHLGRGVVTETQLRDVFGEGTTSISSGVALENYLNRARGNWQNVTVQASTEDTGNDDVDDTVEGRGRNTKFDTEN